MTITDFLVNMLMGALLLLVLPFIAFIVTSPLIFFLVHINPDVEKLPFVLSSIAAGVIAFRLRKTTSSFIHFLSPVLLIAIPVFVIDLDFEERRSVILILGIIPWLLGAIAGTLWRNKPS